MDCGLKSEKYNTTNETLYLYEDFIIPVFILKLRVGVSNIVYRLRVLIQYVCYTFCLDVISYGLVY